MQKFGMHAVQAEVPKVRHGRQLTGAREALL
jgi:hypothetical protein